MMGDFRGYLCGSCDEELALTYAFERNEPESEPLSQAHTPHVMADVYRVGDFRDGFPRNATAITQVRDSRWDISVTAAAAQHYASGHPVLLKRDAQITVISAGDPETLCRPCVDCGLKTGYFCDGAELEGGFACIASDRIPAETWCDGQRTPFCRPCEDKMVSCNFCRGTPWCQPFTRQR